MQRLTGKGLTFPFSGDADGIAGNHKNCASRPPLKRVVRQGLDVISYLIKGGGGQWRDQSSARRFLHERTDPCLFGGSQLLQRESDRPHGTFV